MIHIAIATVRMCVLASVLLTVASVGLLPDISEAPFPMQVVPIYSQKSPCDIKPPFLPCLAEELPFVPLDWTTKWFQQAGLLS